MKKIAFSGLLFFGLLTAGCSTGTGPTVQNAPETSDIKFQQFQMIAKDGGTVEMPLTQDSNLKIIFPVESLAGDTDLSVGPLPSAGTEWLIPGFELRDSVTKQGPSMSYPAILIFSSNKDLGSDVSVVQRGDKGDTVIPSKVSQKDGKTVVMAQVSHFSAYGVRTLTPEEKADRAQKQEFANFNWVIYVNDTYDMNIGPVKAKIALNFKAVNTSGDIAGKFSGTATAKTVNEMEGGGGRIDATTGLTADPFEFIVGPYIELSPLTPLSPSKDDAMPPLAPLKPAKEPDFIGNGSIHMAGSGSGTVTAAGYSASGGTKSDSTDSITVVITGPRVKLTVSTSTGTMYFNGYIRGEGK